MRDSIWNHSSMFTQYCEDRSRGIAPPMDCVGQLVKILRPLVKPGMTLLDVGCASGHYYHSLKQLDIDYHGIDSCPMAIETGRRNMPRFGLMAERLRLMSLEELPQSEQYDIVVCFNTLMYVEDHRRALRIIAGAARRWLVIRDSFDAKTMIRWEADILLDDGYQDMHAYYNIYGRDELKEWLEKEGFIVKFTQDWRRFHRFGGRAETVGGIAFPYEILIAEAAR